MPVVDPRDIYEQVKYADVLKQAQEAEMKRQVVYTPTPSDPLAQRPLGAIDVADKRFAALAQETLLCDHASTGKPPLALVPRSLVEGVAVVLERGAEKYPLHNWRKGGSYLDFLSSTLRHLAAWQEGQDLDDESGLSHLAHAACNIAFLLEWQARGRGEDDRYKGG